MDQIPVERVVITEAKARSKPMTMMVEFEGARLADRTMIAAGRLKDLACLTECEAEQVSRMTLVDSPELGIEIVFFSRLVILVSHVFGPAAGWNDPRVGHRACHHIVICGDCEVYQN